jgi:predicted nucleic acid-binding protein
VHLLVERLYSEVGTVSEPIVYLDTNILSRIPDLRISAGTAIAYGELARLGGIRLVTSEKTRAEILRTTNPHRSGVLQLLVALVEKVPYEVVHYSGAIGAAPIGATPISGDWTDPLYQDLRSIFDPDDAEHIVQAVHANCAFFLTLDETSILSRARAHASRVSQLCPGLRFVSPEEVVAALKARSAEATC